MAKLHQCRDVATGRFTKAHAGYGREWKVRIGEIAWWVVSVFECEPHPADGHTHEVCLGNVGRNHFSPTWPILALYSQEDALKWEKALRKFAKTISAEREHDHFDKAINGDRRFGQWLADNLFVRFNHIWWRHCDDVGRGPPAMIPPVPPPSRDPDLDPTLNKPIAG